MTGHLDIKDLEKMKKDDLKALAKDMGIRYKQYDCRRKTGFICIRGKKD